MEITILNKNGVWEFYRNDDISTAKLIPKKAKENLSEDILDYLKLSKEQKEKVSKGKTVKNTIKFKGEYENKEFKIETILEPDIF